MFKIHTLVKVLIYGFDVTGEVLAFNPKKKQYRVRIDKGILTFLERELELLPLDLDGADDFEVEAGGDLTTTDAIRQMTLQPDGG